MGHNLLTWALLMSAHFFIQKSEIFYVDTPFYLELYN